MDEQGGRAGKLLPSFLIPLTSNLCSGGRQGWEDAQGTALLGQQRDVLLIPVSCKEKWQAKKKHLSGHWQDKDALNNHVISHKDIPIWDSSGILPLLTRLEYYNVS